MKNYIITFFGKQVSKIELSEDKVVDFINKNKNEVEISDEDIRKVFLSYVKNGSHEWGLHIGCEFQIFPIK